MRRLTLAALAAAVVGVTSVNAQSSTATMPAKSDSNHVARVDRHFVEEAAEGGMREVKLGELAQGRALDGGVKAFGQRMVADHTQANNELKALAAAKGITIKADEKKDRDYDKLSAKAGNEFDEDYVKMMVKDHKKTIKLFEDEAKDGKDADLQAFANKTLPTLREHLAQAQALKKKD